MTDLQRINHALWGFSFMLISTAWNGIYLRLGYDNSRLVRSTPEYDPIPVDTQEPSPVQATNNKIQNGVHTLRRVTHPLHSPQLNSFCHGSLVTDGWHVWMTFKWPLHGRLSIHKKYKFLRKKTIIWAMLFDCILHTRMGIFFSPFSLKRMRLKWPFLQNPASWKKLTKEVIGLSGRTFRVAECLRRRHTIFLWLGTTYCRFWPTFSKQD